MLTAPPRMAVVGNSHVLTLLEGYQLVGGRLPAGLELSFIARGPQKIGYVVASPAGLERREPTGSLVDLVGELAATHLFVTWKGSQANLRGLLLSGPAFDVVLPADGERLPDPEIELVPCSAVEAYVRATLEGDEELALLIDRGLKRGAKVWLMGPPPALPVTAVRERLGNESHFAARLREIGISAADVQIVAAPVRVRLRTILLGVYREFAAAHGAGFCPPPSRVADEAGVLLPEFWGKDITHGSATYGAAYLQELLTLAVAARD
jgi:hypothetical protein